MPSSDNAHNEHVKDERSFDLRTILMSGARVTLHGESPKFSIA